MIEQGAHYLPDLLSLAPIFLAFSLRTRNIIKNRDKADVIDGSTDRLEAAHINHDKHSRNYDDPSNGRLLTAAHHYMDHLLRAGKNGLSMQVNNWALRKIWERLTDEERKRLPPPPNE